MLLAIALFLQGEAITVTARETKAEEKLVGFVVEGKAPLPDDAIVSVEMFRDGVAEPLASWYGVAPIQAGSFRATFSLFKEKNLKGRYRFRVKFEPDLQREEHRKHSPSPAEFVLAVGTPEEIDAEARGWAARVNSELEELGRLLDGVKKTFETAPEKLDEAILVMTREFSTIQQRNAAVPELRFLGLHRITHTQFDRLKALADACVECWKNQLAKPQEAPVWKASAEASFGAFVRLKDSLKLEAGPKKNEEWLSTLKEAVDLHALSLDDGRVRAELKERIEERRARFRAASGGVSESTLKAAQDILDKAANAPTRESVDGLKADLKKLEESPR